MKPEHEGSDDAHEGALGSSQSSTGQHRKEPQLASLAMDWDYGKKSGRDLIEDSKATTAEKRKVVLRL
jgi:hypothetical protein